MKPAAILKNFSQYGLSQDEEDVILDIRFGGLWQTYLQFPKQAEMYQTRHCEEVTPELRDAVKLAINLIQEEVSNELLPALHAWEANPSREHLVEVLDGIVDSVYVIFQLCYTLNLPFEAGFARVHLNNMEKIQHDEHGKLLKREDGKLLKPAGHSKPDLFSLLEVWSNQEAYRLGLFGAENWRGK